MSHHSNSFHGAAFMLLLVVPDHWRAANVTSTVTASGGVSVPVEDAKAGQAVSALSLDTLSCDSFYYPGSTSVPFPFPPPRQKLTSCR